VLRERTFTGVRLGIVTLAAVVLFAVACGQSGEASLVDYRDPRSGFVVRHPARWIISADPTRSLLWVVPPAFAQEPATAPEFILVLTRAATAQLDEAGRREALFTLVSIHGVSEFRRDARATPTLFWDRFEVTGASGTIEWASAGVVVTGDRGFHVLVCAKPFAQWRTGQQQCAEVVATFQPGPLAR